MNSPNDKPAATSRTDAPFLKVTIPVNETRCPSAMTSSACSRVPPKQWKTPAHSAAVIAHDFESIGPGIALMNDDIQLELDRKIELLLKEARLFALERAIVNSALDLVVRLRLERA